MPDTKITALAAITTVDPAADVLPIVDISDTSMAASGTTKKITSNQILGAGGTATLASATITGDLTVATDRLKVVTGSTAVQIGSTTQTQIGTTAWPTSYIAKSGSRVLIGSAGELILWNEAAAAIGNNSTLFVGAKSGPVATIIAGGAIKGGIENTSDYSGFLTLSTQRSDASMIERYRIDSTGIATWSNVGGVAGTAMTLNATGLGVGTASPLVKINGQGTAGDPASSGTTQTGAMLRASNTSTGAIVDIGVSNTGNRYGWIQATNSGDLSLNYDLVINKNGGNVGIGVTPSAWLSTFKSLQVGGYGAISNSPGNDLVIGNNWYNDTSDKRINAGYASRMFFGQSANGGFSWQLAGTSTAGSTISWATAMQLDANGNLILQSSATPATLTTNGQLTVNATSNTNLRFSYRGSDGVTRVADLTLA